MNMHIFYEYIWKSVYSVLIRLQNLQSCSSKENRKYLSVTPSEHHSKRAMAYKISFAVFIVPNHFHLLHITKSQLVVDRFLYSK